MKQLADEPTSRLVQADDTADPHRPITMAYDTLDRLLSETTALGTIRYDYDPLGRRTQMQVNALNPVSYTYDAASRLRSITQAPLNPVAIDYDAIGRRTKLTLPNGVSTEYHYDAASRLTALIYRNAAGLLGDLTYTYDASGNRTDVGGSFARTLLPDPIASATYDVANRQLTFGDKRMTYDANGNLTSITEPSGPTTFTWDARNQLTALNGLGNSASFAYDAFGRRATKTINGQQTQFQYDGQDIISELSNGTEATYLRTLNIDEPLARTGSEFYLTDALGSILSLADGTGTLLARYSYEPFGRIMIEGTASLNHFQYTGRENDGLAGLYFYRARYYSPTLHRFVSEDPIGFSGGDANFYAYALNNPLKFNDPTGELVLQLIGLAGGALGGGISALVNQQDVRVGIATGALVGLASSFVGPGLAVGLNTLGNIATQVSTGNGDVNLTSLALAAATAFAGKGLGAALLRKEVPRALTQITTGLAFTPNAAGISAVLSQAFAFRLSDLCQHLSGRKCAGVR